MKGKSRLRASGTWARHLLSLSRSSLETALRSRVKCRYMRCERSLHRGDRKFAGTGAGLDRRSGCRMVSLPHPTIGAFIDSRGCLRCEAKAIPVGRDDEDAG